jgi:hypothetical protein
MMTLSIQQSQKATVYRSKDIKWEDLRLNMETKVITSNRIKLKRYKKEKRDSPILRQNPIGPYCYDQQYSDSQMYDNNL